MARRHSGSCAKRASVDARPDERLRLPSDAFVDLDEIWEYIAQDIDAGDRVLADIHTSSAPWRLHRNRAPTSAHPGFRPNRSRRYANAAAEMALMIALIRKQCMAATNRPRSPQ